VSGVFVLTLVILVVSVLMLLPGLIADARNFLQELPENSSKAIEQLEQLSMKAGLQLDLSRQGLGEFVHAHASALSSDVIAKLSRGLRGAFSNLFKWFLALLNLFLVPLFFFYLINDYEKISAEMTSFIPKRLQSRLKSYASMSNTVLNGYIRGQLMVAVILGLLYGVGLSVVGLRFGFLIGFVSGLLCIVPYVGFTLGLVTALMIGMANFGGWGTIGGVLAVFLVVQLLEGFVITPKLVGGKVGLSAFATILALIIGGNLLGLAGMLLAIPVAAVLKVVLADLKREYQASAFYRK